MFNSRSTKIAVAAIAAILVAGLAWFLVTHWPAKDSLGITWSAAPSKTHTLILRPADSKESLRFVDYAPDHQTILGMRIEYRDGKTALVTYQNGTPTTINTYFAVPKDPSAKPADASSKLDVIKHLNDGLAGRTLASVIVLKADGKTIKSLTSYQADGNYAAVGVRDSADDFAVTMYGANGVSAIAVFSGTDGTLKSEQDFRDDGSVSDSFTTQTTDGSTAKETMFDTNGAKTQEVDFGDGSSVAIKDFAADGKTVVGKTAFDYSGITVTKYDATGTNPVIERVYSSDSSQVTVRYFDDKGNATFKQVWNKLDTTAVPADQVGVVSDGYYLNEVDEFHSGQPSVKMAVTFYPGGKVVQEVMTRASADYRPSVDQHFRADGSLDYTENCPAEGDSWTPCSTTKEPDGPNKIRAKVSASFLKVTPLLPLPAVQKPTIPALPLTVDLR